MFICDKRERERKKNSEKKTITIISNVSKMNKKKGNGWKRKTKQNKKKFHTIFDIHN